MTLAITIWVAYVAAAGGCVTVMCGGRWATASGSSIGRWGGHDDATRRGDVAPASGSRSLSWPHWDSTQWPWRHGATHRCDVGCNGVTVTWWPQRMGNGSEAVVGCSGSVDFVPKVTCSGSPIRYLCTRSGKEKLTFSIVDES